jgi:hypothetical protein
MPRAAIEWGYAHLAQGDRLGGLIAEYYFIDLDRSIIKSLYPQKAPAERYSRITELFPDIHNRVPRQRGGLPSWASRRCISAG